MILISYIFFIASIILIFMIDKLTIKRVWFDPLYVFLILMIIYVSPLNIRYIFNLAISGNVTYMFYDIKNIFPYSVMLTTISLWIFYFFYRISKPIFITKKLIKLGAKLDSLNLPLSITGKILVILGFSIFLIISNNNGGITSILLEGYGVTKIFADNPILEISLYIAYVGSFFLLFSGRKKTSIIIFLIIMTINIILGRRSQLIIWGMAYAIFYFIKFRFISFKKILPFILVSFILLNILGYIRNSNYKSYQDLYERSIASLEHANHNSSSMYYTLTDGQFVVPFETLPVLMNKLEPNDYYYGSSLLDTIIQWIPRFIFPSKSYGLSNWYYRSFYDQNASPNTGRQFFFLSEGFINFGIIGIFIWAGLWGFFWKNISSLIKYSPSTLTSFIFSIYVSSMILLLSGDSVSLFVATPKSSIIWLFLGYIIAIVIKYIKKGLS
ncbi:hypothetical protein [Xenorhabdus cabanillasii]|uniref:Oligosaccharide repeat unit polymerase n=1 Tax=Xenorhabdus cabanillasii JM26 TaxID=1427517 RepID=W1J189_9GAMM|nr:hypothetical protein [Xenorhabdus cabanillasii]PHM77692.1 hypothetical protein Xcab_01722 [Xenorhabdus cabanillasii JM26]CDL84459.1 membrane hypothetical protein [Xenorhabdus cabanillasii JM26]